MLLPIERKTQGIAVDVPALDDLTRKRLHLAVYFLLHRGHIPLKGCTAVKPTSPLSEIARVLMRLDHVALTDLTHFRIFPRNLAPDFTHYFSERPEMSSQ